MKVFTAWNGSAYVPVIDAATNAVLVLGNERPASITVSWNGGVKPSKDSSNTYSAVVSAAGSTGFTITWGPSDSGATITIIFYLGTLKWAGYIRWKYGADYVVNIERQCTLPDCSPVGSYTITSTSGGAVENYDVTTAVSVSL